jgi:NADH-quinone oxidoreductase subunit L
MESKALLAIVLFPLLGAVLNGLLGCGVRPDWAASRRTVHMVACLSVAASFVFSLFCFVQLVLLRHAGEGEHAGLYYTAYEWFSITLRGRAIPVDVRFTMDALSGVMALVVTGIGLLIHIYSTGYMSEEKSYARFFSYLNLFTGSMLILVLGSNLPLMFVGWEGVGLCSYLLIGFWWENPAYAAAGRKAFIANRIGDFGVVIGMLLLVSAVHSFEFSAINAHAAELQRPVMLSGMAVLPISVATAATLFLFLGCTGKSAQIPLYVWLPDAMAGPTPVSALIHAATMVTSGLYLICRLSPIFAVAPATMAVVAITGTLTALLAATIACVQNDIKKVLAYSTVSQLGFMFAAAGCGAFAASFFHVYTHAFFKACLFLGAGSVMHAVGAHGDADIRRLGGLRKHLPRTHWTFLASCLAIAGVPGLSGFFSKDEILVGALSVGHYLPGHLGVVIFVLLVICAALTAFYMFRLYFLTFSGEYRGGPEHHDDHHAAASDDSDHAAAHPHESPPSMTIPLVVLGAGAVVAGCVWVGIAGLFGLEFQPWVDWLEPALGSIGHGHHGKAVLAIAALTGTLAAATGIGLAYSWYGRPGMSGMAAEAPRKLAERFATAHRLAFEKWRVDEFYDATVLRTSRGLALLSAGLDKEVIDGFVSKVTAATVRGLGFVLTRIQNGVVHGYAAVMVAGFLFVTAWFAIPSVVISMPEPPKDRTVQLHAAQGLGYRYRWDFAEGGGWGTEWSPDAQVSHVYADRELRPTLAVVIEPGNYGGTARTRQLERGQRLVLPSESLGARWQRNEAEDTPPVIEATANGVLVRANSARLRREGKTLSGDSVLLERGEHVDIGAARITATGLARATLRVRNAFGVEREASIDIMLPHVAARVPLQVVGVAEAGR